ncbi:MAG: hypothetical protein FWB80_03310 [Defluviitaleaceae bacterium]|nr:hypothetical protein [Defluviitaleaceae bacterium]
MAKYDMLYPPLVERVFAENANKRDPIKAAKTQMHQMYGAYLQGKTHKKASELLDLLGANAFGQKNKCDTTSGASASSHIMELHASTKERLPFVKQFYGFIAKHTASVEMVLDLGCGFNPFALLHMMFLPKAYHAYDIDLRTKDLLNQFFKISGLPQTAKCADLAVETPTESVDLALMLKLVPVLEAQKLGRGYELANALNTRFLVISYPLKSLGRREKGMGKNYAASFRYACESGSLNNFSILESEKIGNELVYILLRL